MRRLDQIARAPRADWNDSTFWQRRIAAAQNSGYGCAAAPAVTDPAHQLHQQVGIE
jgi:hypothetical protein